MGKFDFFTITFAKQMPLYFSGEALVGSINFRLKERLKINSLKLNILGEAYVHWTERHGSGKTTRTVHYRAREVYLSHDIIFLHKSHDSDLYLEPGDYSYPFNIILPPNLPTSFEHHFGYVRYSLYSLVDIPWAFDMDATRSFSVISHLDLNSNPMLRQPYGVSAQKVLCCGPCKSDPIIANFNVFKGGYVPGEAIIFNIIMDNRSSREIKEMTVNLFQLIRFHSTRKTRMETRNVSCIKYPKRVDPKKTEKWTGTLIIPPVCSSSNGTCRIIEVSYTLVFNFDASGIALSEDLGIPIVIGTIPLTAEANAMMMQPQIPFTYEPSLFDASRIQADDTPKRQAETISSDANTFKPFYPYYKDFGNVNANS